MARFCMTCGRQLREGDSFCLGCGTPVSGGGPSAGVAAGALNVASRTPLSTHSNAGFSSLVDVDSESDQAETEVWHVSAEANGNRVDSFLPREPKSEPKVAASGTPASFESVAFAELGHSSPSSVVDGSGSLSSALEPLPLVGNGSDEGEYDESPTIVATTLEGDDDEDSPTIVVAHERYVLVRDEDGQRTEFSLPCVVGRGRAADKRVKGNLAISREHARLFQNDGLVLIEDLKSTNGTFVDGVLLEEGQSVPVSEGAAVRLGNEDFTFHIEAI